jgi:hypothetical protein
MTTAPRERLTSLAVSVGSRTEACGRVAIHPLFSSGTRDPRERTRACARKVQHIAPAGAGLRSSGEARHAGVIGHVGPRAATREDIEDMKTDGHHHGDRCVTVAWSHKRLGRWPKAMGRIHRARVVDITRLSTLCEQVPRGQRCCHLAGRKVNSADRARSTS